MSDRINELKMNELKDMFFYTFGIVPLQNYGVIGDGMTDNRLKIQQAIYDAIEVKAKCIFVPKGNYYYSQELFKADEVDWLGNSTDAYIKGVEIKQFPSFDNVVNIVNEYSEKRHEIYSAGYLNKELDKKVDKVEGKGLSTNDFTDEYKQKVDDKVDKVDGKGLSSNDFTDEYIESINNKVNKVEGKELSSNDFTDEYKQKIDNKVDKVEGKDLSTNDFTDEYKQQLDNPINVSNKYSTSTNDTYSSDYINQKLDSKVDKVEGKELSSNDFTDEYKQKIDNNEAVSSVTPHKYTLSVEETTEAGAEITLPCYYKVGTDCLDVILEGDILIKSSDEEGTDGHYVEVGETDNISNKIKITNDWAVEAGMTFEFVVRGEYTSGTE